MDVSSITNNVKNIVTNPATSLTTAGVVVVASWLNWIPIGLAILTGILGLIAAIYTVRCRVIETHIKEIELARLEKKRDTKV